MVELSEICEDVRENGGCIIWYPVQFLLAAHVAKILLPQERIQKEIHQGYIKPWQMGEWFDVAEKDRRKPLYYWT